MDNKLAGLPAAPTPSPEPVARPAQPPAEPARTAGPPPQEQADLRLIIEHDRAAQTYVYKTVDRRTGEVVSQIPREEVLQMREVGEYQAGDVIRAKA